MDRFQAMQAFAHVVEQAGFGKASLVMGVATPTISIVLSVPECRWTPRP
jgi:DNA-binding transcriptional LysR family regulator